MFQKKFLLRSILLSIVWVILGCLQAYAQNRSVSGTVKDGNGVALPGVSVSVKGSTRGTITNDQGAFRLTVQTQDSALEFSCIGFEGVEIPLTQDRSVYDVTMGESAEFLEDVVVVGYGVQKKVNLTGAVSSMKFDDVQDIPVSNTAALLQGRMSGVTVTNYSAQPGVEDLEIRIRGIGTLNDANPLILIDGVEGNLNSVPAEDIESISVLKDAASASIYGVRAANGVVLVTTRKGQGEKTISYSGSYGVQQATRLPFFADSWQWAQLFNENNEAVGDITGNYTDEMIQKMKDGSDPDHFANTNWMKVLFRTANMQKHHLSLSGGDKDSHYLASIGFLSQDGIMQGTGTKRGSFRMSTDTRVLDLLTLGVSTSGSYQKAQEPQGGVWDLFNFAANKTRPTIPTYYSDGHFGAYDGNPFFTNYSRTPLYATSLSSYTTSYKFDGKAFAMIEPVKNLQIQSSFAYQIYNDRGESYSPTSYFYTAEGDSTPSGIPTMYYSNVQRTQWIQENTINYHFDLGNAHHFAFLLGESTQYNHLEYSSRTGQHFLSEDVHVLDAAQQTSSTGSEYTATLRSFFGRFNYNFMDRYLLEVNLRRDESSRIPSKNRTGYFPSVSAGWNVAKEPFFQSVSLISNLKFRASWGKLGNQEIGFYPYAATYALGEANYIWGGTKMSGAAASSGSNPDIKWEVTTTKDLGIDLGLFEDRITASFDLFDKNTSGILLQLPVSALLGVSEAAYVNAAEVSNKGWEANLGYRNHWGDWGFFANLNVSHVINKIIDVDGREDWIDDWTINVADAPIGAYYGYIADGLYKSEEEIEAIPVAIGTARVGDIKYIDFDKDGTITDKDRTIIGNPFPKLTYGLNLGASWKQFDLSVFLQGIGGVDRIFLDYPTVEGGVTQAKLDRFHATNNPNGTFPAMGNQAYNSTPSSFWIKDASYCRIKNVELGYNLPHVLKGIRLYVSGQNLFTFTKVQNFDPEKYASDRNNATYPNARIVTVGVNIKL